jgi:hypothetical protein
MLNTPDNFLVGLLALLILSAVITALWWAGGHVWRRWTMRRARRRDDHRANDQDRPQR